jgi:hypothetical protein
MNVGRQMQQPLFRWGVLLLVSVVVALVGLGFASLVPAPQGAAHSCPAGASRSACSYPPNQARWLVLWAVAGFVVGLITVYIAVLRFRSRAN